LDPVKVSVPSAAPSFLSAKPVAPNPFSQVNPGCCFLLHWSFSPWIFPPLRPSGPFLRDPQRPVLFHLQTGLPLCLEELIPVGSTLAQMDKRFFLPTQSNPNPAVGEKTNVDFLSYDFDFVYQPLRGCPFDLNFFDVLFDAPPL